MSSPDARNDARDRLPRPAKAALGSDYARYAGLGAQFAASVGVLAWLGWWGDERLHTRPWLLLAGVLLGFAGGLIAIVRAVPAPRPARPAGVDSKPRDGGE